MSSLFSLGSDTSKNLFSVNINKQTQKNLFGAPDNKPPDEGTKITFGSSLFNKENNNKPLFGDNKLFNSTSKNEDKTEEKSIFKSTNFFSSGFSNNTSSNNFLFGNPKDKNETNKNKEDSNKNTSPLFNLGGDNIKKENENNNDIKNKNETINEDKKTILELFGPPKKEGLKPSFGQQPPNIEEKKLFQFGQNENENKEIFKFDKNGNEKDNKLFKFDINENGKNKNIFGADENEKEKEKEKSMQLFNFNVNANKKSIKLFEGKEKEKKIKFFSFDDNSEENKQPDIINNDNKEESKQPDVNNNEEKEIKKGKNIFGTPKKEQEKTKIEKLIDKKDELEINTNIKENNLNSQNNINILSSSQRFEDNEDVQKALKNLYFSDILLPNKLYSQSNQSFLENNNNKNKMKRIRPIDFTLLIEIEGITNMNDEGINITCKSNETMGNLMRQVKILVKKKYKINKEQNDLNNFEFNLIKNSKKLPINEREIIGDNIRNKDIIIASFSHKHSDINEKNENEEEEKADEEKSEENNVKAEKKILCPKDKLPILIRPGYYMKPNEYDISRMTIDEINNVNDFEIYNENGKIHFDNVVSLYGVNFDKLFNIGHDLIEYEKGEWCHSPRGKNFNIPATITLYNIHPNINLSNQNVKRQYLEFLKERCQKNFCGTFISFDFDRGELKYKIPYFY